MAKVFSENTNFAVGYSGFRKQFIESLTQYHRDAFAKPPPLLQKGERRIGDKRIRQLILPQKLQTDDTTWISYNNTEVKVRVQ